MIKLACDLRRSGLLEADEDPDEHPRWLAGALIAKLGSSPRKMTSLRPAKPLEANVTTFRLQGARVVTQRSAFSNLLS